MQLKSNQEVVGVLKQVIPYKGSLRLIFSIEREVCVPVDALFEENIYAAVGRRIGIFNCDGMFRMRVIDTTGGRVE